MDRGGAESVGFWAEQPSALHLAVSAGDDGAPWAGGGSQTTQVHRGDIWATRHGDMMGTQRVGISARQHLSPLPLGSMRAKLWASGVALGPETGIMGVSALRAEGPGF